MRISILVMNQVQGVCICMQVELNLLNSDFLPIIILSIANDFQFELYIYYLYNQTYCIRILFTEYIFYIIFYFKSNQIIDSIYVNIFI